MAGRQVTVFGEQFLCSTDECKRYAMVLYRSNLDGELTYLSFCRQHWQEFRRAYERAEMDVDIVTRIGGDEDDARRV